MLLKDIIIIINIFYRGNKIRVDIFIFDFIYHTRFFGVTSFSLLHNGETALASVQGNSSQKAVQLY